MGGRTGRGGGRTRGRSGDQGNGRTDGQGGKVGGQGSEVNDGVNGVLDFSTIIAHQLQNLLPTIVAQIEKMKLVQDMSGCRDSQKVKYTPGLFVDFKTLTREEFCSSNEMQKLETELGNHAMVGAGHAAYTDTFHELARLVPHLVTPEAIEPMIIQKAMQIAGTLTDEALKNGSIKKTSRKEETGENLVRIGMERRITRELGLGMLLLQPPTLSGEKTRVQYPIVPPVTLTIHPRPLVAHVSTVTTQVESSTRTGREPSNQALANNRGLGRRNQWNQARGRAFILGAEEARQDLNIMTGTFTLNDHYATTLFDSGAD
ncbi:hypothetical protein Tco_0789130, partial [Tanacetum coccineum]